MPDDIKRVDVAVLGGGVVGCATAYFVQKLAPDACVAVIEPDPTYEWCSSLRAAGGCRVQFTTPENIELSKFSIDFIKSFGETMAVAHGGPETGWKEGGYLFVVPPDNVEALEANVQLQVRMGCEVGILSADELRRKFPSMNVDGLGAGALSPRDGWCDPNALLWGFRKKAASMGVTFIKSRVVAMDCDALQVRSVRLEDGSHIAAEHVVNAAGAWSNQISSMAGMHLPITPMKRYEHYFTAATPIEALPFVKDVSRLAFRPEGAGFSGGLVDSQGRRGFNFDVDHDYWENVVWPHVAHRFPALEAARCHRSWSGLYEQCELDGNAIIGRWDNGLRNLYTVAGFSGHGMMHAPGAGRGIAELIVHGAYQTIDLARLGYARVERNEPYREKGII